MTVNVAVPNDVELTVTIELDPRQTDVAEGEEKSVMSGGVLTTKGADIPCLLPAHPAAVAVRVYTPPSARLALPMLALCDEGEEMYPVTGPVHE